MSNFRRIPSRYKSYVGIDLHTTSLAVTVVPDQGDRLQRESIPTHCVGRLERFFQGLPRPVCVGIESMGSFYWLWDMLHPMVDELILIDALDLSKLAPRQASTDRTIAARIAYVLRDGLVPASYVPAQHIRHLRQFGRQWHNITETSTTAKAQIRWQLYQNNCQGPDDLTGASIQQWLSRYGHTLDPAVFLLIENWENVVLTAEHIRTVLRREMKAIVQADPVLTQQLQIVTSTHGIADILGTIIVAEFANFERFRDSDTVACWTGLTERSHISNRQKYPGRISKAGSSTLRWALCEAAFQLTQSDETYQQMYERLVARTGEKGKARTAMGRRLARYIWKAVVSNTPFRNGPSRKRTQRANEVRLRRKRRKDGGAEKERSNAEVVANQDA